MISIKRMMHYGPSNHAEHCLATALGLIAVMGMAAVLASIIIWQMER